MRQRSSRAHADPEAVAPLPVEAAYGVAAEADEAGRVAALLLPTRADSSCASPSSAETSLAETIGGCRSRGAKIGRTCAILGQKILTTCVLIADTLSASLKFHSTAAVGAWHPALTTARCGPPHDLVTTPVTSVPLENVNRSPLAVLRFPV